MELNILKRCKWIYLQNRNRLTNIEKKLNDYQKGNIVRRRDKLEAWYDYYLIRLIINKDLQYSTGNSSQCSVITYVRKEYKEEYMYMYNWITWRKQRFGQGPVPAYLHLQVGQWAWAPREGLWLPGEHVTAVWNLLLPASCNSRIFFLYLSILKFFFL